MYFKWKVTCTVGAAPAPPLFPFAAFNPPPCAGGCDKFMLVFIATAGAAPAPGAIIGMTGRGVEPGRDMVCVGAFSSMPGGAFTAGGILGAEPRER